MSNGTKLTASHVFDHVQCPHRVTLDAHGDTSRREPPNAFVELLWSGSEAHKAGMAAKLGVSAHLAELGQDERESETRALIAQSVPLIFMGRLTAGDRVAEPDLLELHDGGYRACDMKAGSGFDEDGKIKKSYAVRLAHSTSVLDELGLSDGSGQASIYDSDGQRVSYDLTAAQGVRLKETWMEAYEGTIERVRRIVNGTSHTLPAMSANCKLCVWKTACKEAVIQADDLSLIAELGRAKRDAMFSLVPTVAALASADLSKFALNKKTVFPGIGQETLKKFKERAILLATPGAMPYLKAPVDLPVALREVHFDLETDPTRKGYVYLHGFVECLHGQPKSGRFVPCITPTISAEAEELAFRNAWGYLHERLADSIIYYYSSFERVSYLALAQRYPSVCSVDEVKALFSHPHVIDLYTDVIKTSTEWPTYDLSIKTLAKFLGFEWRDSDPSGASSIQWFNDWVETGDPAILQRILDYNADDCTACAYVVEGVRQLRMRAAAA